MVKSITGIVVKLAIVTVIALAINYALYIFTPLQGIETAFTYSLWVLYAFFFFFSVGILATLLVVSQKNITQTGYLFLFLTVLKMAASYVLARPILAKTVDVKAEKLNFFFIFLLFLAIEAYYTARLLNKKQ
ncbi:hypothetical protein [Flavobacterium rhizosphaerae]|uniref:ATP synthase protein I n=1 Tax=Flavobacterium rhizosphaerae TaxID=3163298 RepID=A0ABW8YZ44_9FLAO